MKRFGLVIGIKQEQIEAYKRLHAGPGVRDLLRKANIYNFSIYLRQLEDGRFYEFACYEYTGADYETDKAWLAAQPANKNWLALCDPMQNSLSGETGWGSNGVNFFHLTGGQNTDRTLAKGLYILGAGHMTV